MKAKIIGIVGGGQLGRMLIPPAKNLGFDVYVLDPTPNSPAGQLADKQIIGSFDNKSDVLKFARLVDILTFEIESAHAGALKQIKKSGKQVHPSPHTLEIIKDKLKQNRFLRTRKIPVTPFKHIKTDQDIIKAAKDFGYPLLLKSRFGAYDGRGNFLIKNERQIKKGLEKLSGADLYVEKFVDFKKELAIMVARDTSGNIKTYPLVETIHKKNICHTVFAPAYIKPIVRKQTEKLVSQIIDSLHGVGVFGIEMFLTKDNKVLINEIAPRVHNSGHYTIEACLTSQFEQHIRAVTGLPLGDTSMKTKAAVMVNILGNRLGDARLTGLKKALAIDGVSIHVYAKAVTKPQRKMGHITCVDKSVQKAYIKANQARKYLSI